MERKNFCSYPFNSFFTYNSGTVRMCCDSDIVGRLDSKEDSYERIWRSPRWEEIRHAFLQDRRHPACEKCWKKEDSGIKSPRDSVNAEKYLSRVSQSGEISSGPENIYFRLGNHCNLKCVMCTPQNSSKWYADADIYRQHVDENFGDEIQFFPEKEQWSQNSLAQAKRVFFAGGEPFLIKSHYRILDFLISSGRAPEVSLVYYSNGTVFPEDLIERFSNFKSVEVSLSIEGTEDSYEYIRHPWSWEKIVENIQRFDRVELPQFQWKIMTVYFLLTAVDIERLFSWRDRIEWRNRPDIILQELTEPVFFDVRTLPGPQKQLLLASLEKLLSNFQLNDRERDYIMEQKIRLDSSEEFESAYKIALARKYLNALDLRRGMNWKNSLPALYEFLT